MEWNVYIENVNNKKIVKFNIFNHYVFNREIEDVLKKNTSKEAAEKQIKSLLMYYYWSKSEWEIIITSWPPHTSQEGLLKMNKESEMFQRNYGKPPVSVGTQLEVAEKIDVYNQVMLNWDVFFNYVWSNRDDMV